MAAAASPVLPPAKRRRVSFGGEPDVREYTPTPSSPPSPPDRVVGGRRVRGGRRGARERSAGAALQRGLPAKEERDRFEVTHVLFGVMLEVEARADAEAFYDECTRCRLYPHSLDDLTPDEAEAEARRKERRLPRHVASALEEIMDRDPYMPPSLPSRPGPVYCWCRLASFTDEPPVCEHDRCVRRHRRVLPRVTDAWDEVAALSPSLPPARWAAGADGGVGVGDGAVEDADDMSWLTGDGYDGGTGLFGDELPDDELEELEAKLRAIDRGGGGGGGGGGGHRGGEAATGGSWDALTSSDEDDEEYGSSDETRRTRRKKEKKRKRKKEKKRRKREKKRRKKEAKRSKHGQPPPATTSGGSDGGDDC